jgi:hypothetical protein
MIPSQRRRGSLQTSLSLEIHPILGVSADRGRLDLDQTMNAVVGMHDQKIDLHAGDPAITSEDSMALASQELCGDAFAPSSDGQMSGDSIPGFSTISE